MGLFKITLNHDQGKVDILVFASCRESAVEIICLNELCPRRAVSNVEQIKIKN